MERLIKSLGLLTTLGCFCFSANLSAADKDEVNPALDALGMSQWFGDINKLSKNNELKNKYNLISPKSGSASNSLMPSVSMRFSDRDYSAASSNAKGGLSLSQADTLLYYELEHDWLNLDFGVNVKAFEGRARSASARGDIQHFGARVPTLYGRVFFDLPVAGFSMGGMGSVIDYDASQISDMEMGLSYQSNVGFGASTGWRSQNIRIQEYDEGSSHIQDDALFLDAFYHF